MTQGHIKYVWAGYRRGVFEDSPGFEDGMDAPAFASRLTERLMPIANGGGDVVIASADTKHGHIPVALITISYDAHVAYPHQLWLPEATTRNKIEVDVKFAQELKKEHLILIPAREGDVAYFRHLCKYGLFRPVGKIRGYFQTEDAMLFQSVGN